MKAMFRRALLAAPLLLPISALAQPQAAALSERDQRDIAAVEAYLNRMTTLRARFLQIAQNGASAQGWAYISRPGRMRFDYDPPEPLLLVADGSQFLLYDRELKAPTTLPTVACREEITPASGARTWVCDKRTVCSCTMARADCTRACADASAAKV